MIVKEYNIPLYRRVAKCKLKSTEPIRSDIYLKSSHVNNLEINKDNFKTEIYNITRNPTSLIIYSNTTNLKITNKYFNNIPLYQVIRNIPLTVSIEIVELIKDLVGEQLLIENKDEFVTIYLNTDLKTISKVNGIVVEDVLVIGDSAINRINNVSIRKLKDRLKITIKDLENTENYSIRLGSNYLFEPKRYKNWIEFYECVFPNLNQTFTHVYNHSFNIVRKTEYYDLKEYNIDELKDPFFLSDINIQEIYFDKEVFVSYNSYRSNLLIPSNYNEELFIYLDISGNLTNKTKNFHVSTKELNLIELVPVLTKRKENDSYEFVSNEFNKTIIRTCNSEGYTFMMDTFKNEKYNKFDDIRIGNSRIIANILDVISNKENYISNINGQEIIQSNDLNVIPVPTRGSIPVTGESTLLVSLKDNVTTYLQNQSAFVDKYKIYNYKE